MDTVSLTLISYNMLLFFWRLWYFRSLTCMIKPCQFLQINSNGGRYLDYWQRWLDSKSMVCLQRIMRCRFGVPCWTSTVCWILHIWQRNNHRSMMISTRPILKKKYWMRSDFAKIISKLKLSSLLSFLLAGSADGLLRFWENDDGEDPHY